MRIHVQPDAVEDLLAYLRRVNCKAEVGPDGIVVVEVPGAYGEEQARMELDLYLKAWQASRPDLEAHLLETPRSGVEGVDDDAD
ncbi:MAG TPA: hypothetical protein VE615_13025 [Gaiellaceae bacterium]|jgi:hypothetical protein|nr:hypothetical protein [Gaiellaceae bacterium]